MQAYYKQTKKTIQKLFKVALVFVLSCFVFLWNIFVQFPIGGGQVVPHKIGLALQLRICPLGWLDSSVSWLQRQEFDTLGSFPGVEPPRIALGKLHNILLMDVQCGNSHPALGYHLSLEEKSRCAIERPACNT